MDSPLTPDLDSKRVFSKKTDLRAAFSLVEVTLAIGIIAVGFVAILGLLPIGLSTYRSAIDTANESWIVQSLSSMVQVTSWDKVVKDLESGGGGNIYYYDEEGRLTDTELKPSSDPEVVQNRLYAAKLIVEPLYQPRQSGPPGADDEISGARRVIAVISKTANPAAMAQFKAVTDATTLINTKPRNPDLRIRSFIAAQMDSR